MAYKNHLLSNYETLYKVREMLNTLDPNYFSIIKINEKSITPRTISIVMTASNRTIQTYYTLGTIAKSPNKDVQIILVDDSTHDPLNTDKLQKFNMHIELINIKNKFWVNPCVNYNIGFKHIKGSKVIIQNAEVCHKGDILTYVLDVVNNNEYHAFNVYALDNLEQNTIMQNTDMEPTSLKGMWYQHPQYRNLYYHFLVALTKQTFDIIDGFDIDYSVGIDYDDNGLVDKVKNNNISFINVTSNLMGIHQWHAQSSSGSRSGLISNEPLYHCKKYYFNKYRKFLNLTSFPKDSIKGIIENLL